MKLSTRGRYGLRALLELALNYDEGPLPLREIAHRQQLSENYLEQLIAALRRADIVKSIRGPSGGYYLSRPPQKISLGEIFRVLEGPLAPVECTSNLDECPVSTADCYVYHLWQDLSDKVNQIFDEKNLAAIISDAKKFKHVSGCCEHRRKE